MVVVGMVVVGTVVVGGDGDKNFGGIGSSPKYLPTL